MRTPGCGRSGSRNNVDSIRCIPSSSRTRATAPISESVLRVARLASTCIIFRSGKNPAEDLFVLHLTSHDGFVDAFGLERLDRVFQAVRAIANARFVPDVQYQARFLP